LRHDPAPRPGAVRGFPDPRCGWPDRRVRNRWLVRRRALRLAADGACGRLGDQFLGRGDGGGGSRRRAVRHPVGRRRRGRAKFARRVASVCSGTYLLAEAGLLEGRRCTTHWGRSDDFARRYPAARLEADRIWVRDGPVWTSAGITAGIDLALALIEEDLGRDIAMQVARHLVVFLRRPGGQSQFSAPFAAQLSDSDGTFDELHRWIADNLARDLSVEALAQRVGMSPRHFARVYRKRTGRTPAKAVEAFRLEAARRALESRDARLDIVARDSGLGGADRLRTLFRRQLGIAPRAYRANFAA
jgi:transcriptional regulator GlxA family with amidase domain